MDTRFSRRAIACALFATTALTATSALAQQATTVPFPVRQYQDENGVDLLSGAFTIGSPKISIGDSQMGLNFERRIRSALYRDNMMWNIAVSGSAYTVAVGTSSDAFTLSGSAYTPVEANGSSLTYNSGTTTYTYTASDGTVATFVQRPFNYFFGNASNLSVNTISYPNGKVLTYHYTEDFVVQPHITRYGRRIRAITSNTGYMIHFAYASEDPANSAWGTIITVKALNTSVDTCDPYATSCPETGRPSLDISGSTYTDSEGRVTTYTLTQGVGVTGVKLPGSASDDISIAYTSGKVTSITRFGVTTTYAYSDVGDIRTVTVTRPGGATRVVTLNVAKKVMLSDQNELGKTISFQYDTSNRPTLVTLPEGNSTQLTYDARGNLTQLLRVPKPGSGLSNITLTANYDAACTNVVTCNQPNWTQDAKGNQTDYTYDTAHGGLLTATAPAPTTGAVRPQMRISYTRLGANGLPSATGVFMPTNISQCQTSASCAGTADETKATIAYGQGLLPSSMSKGNGSGTLTATTAASYDVIGNLLAVDGPLSGTSDTTVYRYNLNRDVVGTISPDPDGAGSLPNRALRITYGLTSGLPTKQELGTTAGQTDTAWNAFTPAKAIDVTYDVNRRVSSQKLSAGGTNFALTQTSYDSRGRVDCVAQRMNTSVYESLPASACTLGTLGSNGPDRIAKQVYDNASRAVQLQEAFGTTDATNERTLTYTDNGLVSSLKDAENNLTTYEYDGFDRGSKIRFPVSTKGANSSSATDYEQLSYDVNSNVISWRERDGATIAFNFDNLDRATLKDLPGSEPDVTYAYDNLGRLVSASQTGNALSFTWDALSRNLTQVGPQGAATSDWDLAGRRIQLTYPGSGLYVNYDYLITDEVTKVRENGAINGVGVLATYAYDSLGNRTSVTFGNGVAQAFTFDPVSRLASLTNDLSGTTNDLSATFAYNPASQITSTVRTGDTYAWTGHGNGSTAFTQNGLNQQVTVGGAAATWDSKGNLTTDPQSAKTYSYSSENLLTSASGGVTLGYDPALRLYQVAGAATTRFAYDGTDAIAEYNGSNTLQRRFVFGPGMDEPIVQYEGSGTADRRFMSADERGSIISLTDSSGTVLTINRYDEYGKPQATNAGRFQYTGQKWLSEAGLYDYKARDYLPHLGIFAQTDPIGQQNSPNLYGYVGADPVNFIDPLGLDEIVITAPRIIPSNLVGHGSIGVANNTYHHNNHPIIINGLRKFNERLLPGPMAPNPNVICAPTGCLNGVIIIGAAKGWFDGLAATGPHNWTLDLPLCDGCSMRQGFEAMRSFSAPGAPYARAGGPHRVVLWGGNPIKQTVDTRAMTILNKTDRGHVFGGKVEISIRSNNGVVSAHIVGSGVGPNSGWNQVLGPKIFSTMGFWAYQSLSSDGGVPVIP